MISGLLCMFFPRSVRKGRKIHFKNICFAQSSTSRGLIFIMQPLTFYQDLYAFLLNLDAMENLY
jgi:hypothetical protein